MKKRIIIVSIVMIMLLSFASNAMAFGNSGLAPEIMIDRDMEVPTLQGGRDNLLELTLSNYTRYDAKNVKVTLDFMALSQYVTVNELNGTKVLGDMKEYSKSEVDYSFYLSETVQSGVYLIKFTYTYTNELSDPITNTEEIYVNVVNELAPSSIYISNIKASPEKINAEDAFKIGIEITNAGDIYAKNISIDMNNFEPYHFAPVNSTDKAYITKINGKESVWVYFNVTALKDIESTLCDLNFDISYEDPDNNKKSMTIPAYLKIETGETTEETVYLPKMIIESYVTSEETVLAGTEFTLSVKFKNTSKNESVNNIKVTFDFGSEGVFIPVDSSNTFYIEKIEADGTVEKTIKLYAKTGAVTKFYPIAVTMDYQREDTKDNEQLRENENITVSVKQVARIQVSQLYLPTELPIMSPYNAYFSFYNLGKGTIYNLNIYFEGEGIDGENSKFFAGNLSAGGNNYYDGSFMPLTEGPINGNIVFEFEDEMGNKDFIRQAINFTGVNYNNGGFDDGGLIIDPPIEPWEEPTKEDKPVNYLLIGVIAIASIAVIIGLVAVIKRRKNNEVD